MCDASGRAARDGVRERARLSGLCSLKRRSSCVSAWGQRRTSFVLFSLSGAEQRGGPPFVPLWCARAARTSGRASQCQALVVRGGGGGRGRERERGAPAPDDDLAVGASVDEGRGALGGPHHDREQQGRAQGRRRAVHTPPPPRRHASTCAERPPALFFVKREEGASRGRSKGAVRRKDTPLGSYGCGQTCPMAAVATCADSSQVRGGGREGAAQRVSE